MQILITEPDHSDTQIEGGSVSAVSDQNWVTSSVTGCPLPRNGLREENMGGEMHNKFSFSRATAYLSQSGRQSILPRLMLHHQMRIKHLLISLFFTHLLRRYERFRSAHEQDQKLNLSSLSSGWHEMQRTPPILLMKEADTTWHSRECSLISEVGVEIGGIMDALLEIDDRI